MRRREFIAGLGSAAAWPAVVRAQQPAIPVIGFLDTGRQIEAGRQTARIGARFRLGLREHGYVDGRTVEFLYRYAETQYDRLPALASDLVRQRVALIVATGGSAPALAAKSATRQFRFCSRPPPIRSSLAWSRASTGRAAMSLE
jgi:putative tryptophan/tyrosine transport system substrate-binding protein